MKLKSKAVVVLSLSMMLIGTLIGSLTIQNKDNKNDSIDTQEVIIDNKSNDTIPDSFLGHFNDQYDIDENVKKLIIRYMDAYYKSLYELEVVDTADLFDNELSARISNTAMNYIVNTRKLYNDDLKIRNAHYDLNITNYSKEGDMYYVDLLEDDYMHFAFSKDIESSAYDIENYFVIRFDGTDYKIHDLRKVQGYYLSFYDLDYIDSIDKTYNYLYRQMSDMVSYNNDVLKNKPIESSNIQVSKPYNREAAVEYLDKYYHTRNQEWFNYSETGGNCQNYASQALLAGGIPMDFYGEQQWKCYGDVIYDPEVDESESASGRSRSWVNVGYFYDYALNNYGTGLVTEITSNLNEAKIGDIIIVGNDDLAHTVMISKIVDGHIFVNSNSIDMKDYPISAYNYTKVILIKILGYNQYN